MPNYRQIRAWSGPRGAGELFGDRRKPAVAGCGLSFGLLDLDHDDANPFCEFRSSRWRRMGELRTCALIGVQSCTIEWRVRRAGLHLRLLISPPNSWQYVALMFTSFFHDALLPAAEADIRLIFRPIDLLICQVTTRPFRYSAACGGDDNQLFAQCRGVHCDADATRPSARMPWTARTHEIRRVQTCTSCHSPQTYEPQPRETLKAQGSTLL